MQISLRVLPERSDWSPDKRIELEINEFFKNLSELNETYFKVHGKDPEILVLKEKSLQKLAEIGAVFTANKGRFRLHGLETIMEENLDKYRKK